MADPHTLAGLFASFAMCAGFLRAGRGAVMGAVLHFQPTVLSSQRLSPCGQYTVAMSGCYGPTLLTWVRLPSAGVSFLVAMRPLGDAA